MLMPSVSILGNLNIDIIFQPLRRLPDWGQECLVSSTETRVAGAAGYTSIALAQLGVPHLLAGTVGDDSWGHTIHDTLAEFESIDLSGVEIVPGTSTGVCAALVDELGNRAFVSHAGAAASVDAAFLDRHNKHLLNSSYLLVCGYFFMPHLRGASMQTFLREARERGTVTMLDTGWDPDNWPPESRQEVLSLLTEVDVFLPNLDEAKELTGEDSPLNCARALVTQGAGTVAIKLGADGSLWFDGQQPVIEPGRPVTAIDTTGAGDAFNAALIYAFEQGWEMRLSLSFANALCSLLISRSGDRFPSLNDVLRILTR
jgi:sugar/nucleoside kinase (ribokinase family)